MKKYIAVGIVALFVLVGIAALVDTNQHAASVIESTRTEDTELIHLQAVGLPVIHCLPFYLAIEKGYFNDVGLDIEFVKIGAPNLIIDALVSGKADISSPCAAMGIAGIAEFRHPNTLQIYAASGGDERFRNESLVTAPTSGIQSFQDLTGKRLGIVPGIQWRTIAQHILHERGLTVDEDVTLVELAPSLQVGALVSGQIDALLALEPMTTIAENEGMVVVENNPNLTAIANPFYAGAGIVRRDFATNNPAIVRAYFEALERAQQDIAEDVDAARQYLSGYTPLSDNLINKVSLDVTVKLSNDFTENDIESIEAFHHLFSEYNVIDGTVDTRGMLYELHAE